MVGNREPPRRCTNGYIYGPWAQCRTPRNKSLGSTHCRRSRNDGDRQPAICLDTIHQTTNPKLECNTGRCPGGVCGFHPGRNLAGAVRRLSDRPARTTQCDRHRWRSGRSRLDRLRLRNKSEPTIFLVRYGRHRRRRCLWRNHRQLAQVVPRSPWPMRRGLPRARTESARL